MKKALITLVLLAIVPAIVPAIVSAQTQSRQRLSAEQSNANDSNTVRTRVVGPKASNHAESQKPRPSAGANGSSVLGSSPFTWGNTAIPEQTPRVSAASNNSSVAAVVEPSAPRLVQPTVLAATKRTGESVIVPMVSAPRSPASPSAYIVGIGDVLDIRLPNTTARESTLFTVLKNGVIEYPLLNGPLAVAGLTTDQISSVLSAQIKVIRTPKVNVTVRDYASHAVLVGGLVGNPGRKILRREAMPLFAVLAEALVRPEATSATILRNGKEGSALALKDEQAMTTLVLPGDVIKINGGDVAKQYLYVGGQVKAPGEKEFRSGMTLTQALLSAGLASSSQKAVIKVARRNAQGFLSTNEYSLRSIENGKTPDPLVEPGDRIEVSRAM